MWASLDGTLIDADAPALPLGDRGFTLGDGVFETIAVAGGQARRVDRHLTRLAEGLAALAITPAPDPAALRAALGEVIAANALTTGALRLSVSRGAGGRGVAVQGAGPPRVAVTARAGAAPQTPVTAVLATTVRRNAHSPASHIKALSYLDNVLARQEADGRGADEALLLNTDGRLAEASIANVVLALDGQVWTPPCADGALPGVARAAILDAGAAAVAVVERDDLMAAREIVLTNSLGARAVTHLDGAPVGDGTEGPLCRRLRALIAAESPS